MWYDESNKKFASEEGQELKLLRNIPKGYKLFRSVSVFNNYLGKIEAAKNEGDIEKEKAIIGEGVAQSAPRRTLRHYISHRRARKYSKNWCLRVYFQSSGVCRYYSDFKDDGR